MLTHSNFTPFPYLSHRAREFASPQLLQGWTSINSVFPLLAPCLPQTTSPKASSHPHLLNYVLIQDSPDLT